MVVAAIDDDNQIQAMIKGIAHNVSLDMTGELDPLGAHQRTRPGDFDADQQAAPRPSDIGNTSCR